MQAERDIIIIGGGPAGLTAAQYSARGNLNTLLIEELATGGQMLQIYELENYPGINKQISGAELSKEMEDQALKFGAKIISASVKKVEKKNNIFHVSTDAGDFTAYAVIIATGAKPKMLGAEGEERLLGMGVSYCATCDGPFFKNKKILAIGGGDTACSEALYLSQIADKVVMIHRKERFRAQKALAERVLSNKKIEVRFNTECKEIKGDTKVEKAVLVDAAGGVKCAAGSAKYEENFDAVFIFVGTAPKTESLPPDLEKDESGYIVSTNKMETSIPGLFAAGDVRNTPFRQVVVSCGDGAIAAHCADIYISELKGMAYK
ncbi:MAG: thioredoxin-disulfide reductase [Spirochaetes bacterium]|nr:thioredoxin-disulfide reductase [Spirochaetota bacterium]